MICSFLFGDVKNYTCTHVYSKTLCYRGDCVLVCIFSGANTIKRPKKYYNNMISEIIVEAALCLCEPLDLPQTPHFYSSLWSWRWHYTIGYSTYDIIWYDMLPCLTALPTHSACNSGTLRPIAQRIIVCVPGEYSSWCSQKPFSQARAIEVTLWR